MPASILSDALSDTVLDVHNTMKRAIGWYLVYIVPLFVHSHYATCTALCPWYLFMLLSCSHLLSVTILLYCSFLLNSLLPDIEIYFHVLFSELFLSLSFLISKENTIDEEKDNDLMLSKCTPLREGIGTLTLSFDFFSRPVNRERCHWELHSTSKILGWVKTMTIYQK